MHVLILGNLPKAQREKCNVVGTEEGVESNSCDSVVEICVKAFYFIANEIGRWGAAVGGGGRGIIKLFFHILQQ